MGGTDQKTEKATPRRLEKAREEGQFATAGEFVSSLQFMAFLALLGSYGPIWLTNMQEMFSIELREAFAGRLQPAFLQELTVRLLSRSLGPFLTAGLGVCVASVLLHLLLSGFGWSSKKWMPDLNRLNPGKKLASLFGQNAWAVGKTLIMAVVFSVLIAHFSSEQWDRLQLLPLTTVASAAASVFTSVSDVVWKIASVMVVLGCLDFFRQWKQFNDQMKMSKQDIKEEIRESEGNPHNKGRMRRMQRDSRRRHMMKDVAKATAVIVNPTHYAVAILYDPDTSAAPVVIAKGKNYLAKRIRLRAAMAQVPIVENKFLAQTLYKAVPVGAEIPPALYRAVAEILAYIQRMMDGR